MAVIKFIQAQSFALQASGASSGDTTITLQSFKLSDGTTNITTAMLGDKCYGTLEPNNGTQEEAFQFTGVTQNASGTATLTGVSSVGFISPYTVTSGLSKSHAGGVTVILSNDAGFYGNIITYVNTVAASGAALADNNTAGISKLSVAPATGSNPISVGDNDPRILASGTTLYVNSIQNTGIPYAVATGSANAYTATLASSITTLASGTHLNFLVPITNATSVTLNVNGLGAKTIKKNVSTSLASADLLIGQVASTVYDGTNFQLINPSAQAFLGITKSGQTTQDISSNTTLNIAHGVGAIPKMVKVTAMIGVVAAGYTTAVITGGTTSAVYFAIDDGTLVNATSGASFRVYSSINASTWTDGTITVDATNIIMAWAKNNSPTGTIQIIWEALA